MRALHYDAILAFTKQPTDEFEGSVKVTGGNFDRRDIIGTVNIPLTDTFWVRAQGGYLNEDGYVKRGDQELGGSEDVIGRLQAAWRPTDDLKATFGFVYSRSESEGSPQDITIFDMRPGIEGVWEGNYADWLNDALKADGQEPLAAYNDPRIVRDDYG